ncbi:MAG: hypothetical protein EBZ77_09020, partial [Chitinophagia bacterium]|nr:hypothetical protein [Chitinophagia bacterium]
MIINGRLVKQNILKREIRMRLSFKNIAIVATLLLLVVTGATSYGQSYVETFGQNRVQLRKFDWKFFDTKHFRVYHYDRSGRQLGRYVAEEA